MDPATVAGAPRETARVSPVGVVVVTHGQLATELVNAAEMIVGELPGFAAVSIGWHDDVETAREAIAAAIARVARPVGVIVLTDMRISASICWCSLLAAAEGDADASTTSPAPAARRPARRPRKSPSRMAAPTWQ